MDGNPKKPRPEIAPPIVEPTAPRRPEIEPPGETGEPLPRPDEIDIPDGGGGPEADIPTRPEIEMPDPGGVPDFSPGPEPTEPFPP